METQSLGNEQVKATKKDRGMGIPTLRDWQVKATNAVKELWDADPSAKALVAVCPAGGKTLFACLLAQAMLLDGIIDLVIVLMPGTNIQRQWVEALELISVKVTDKATNTAIKWRQLSGVDEVEGHSAICVNYQQLSKEVGLFTVIGKRLRILLIGDEIHHADDAAEFGKAVSALAEVASFRLALSGTPFNSTGGALAMCDHSVDLDEEGRQIRKTIPTYQYSYGDALSDKVCRPVEFIKVLGKSTITYRSLDDRSEWDKIIDLAKQNKTDSLSMLLDADGDFMGAMIEEALRALTNIKRFDPRAAMLVVVRDTTHGNAIAKRIARLCRKNSGWESYTSQEIYNDTDRAHERIKELRHDRTDIVISVRMISEGVDIKRLRVGLYATDYLTRMFFQQFVGRFTRYEDRLDESQHARIVIPGHAVLLGYAREIELMVLDALIPGIGCGPGPEGPKNEMLGNTTEASATGLVYRGQEIDDRSIGKAFLQKYPGLAIYGEGAADHIAKEIGFGHAGQTFDQQSPKPDWAWRNNRVTAQIVRKLSLASPDQAAVPTNNLFKKINGMANQAVGIKKMDALTPDETLERRHKWLLNHLRSIIGLDGATEEELLA